MKYMRGMLLGAALIVGATSFAAAQAVVQVQWGPGYRDHSMTDTGKDSGTHATTVVLTRTIIAGETAMTGERSDQATSADSMKWVVDIAKGQP
jgi:hypothetical protein